MSPQNVRKPLKNFFIKKSLQVSMLTRIITSMLMSTILTTVILAYIYNLKSKGGSFYYMSDNVMEDLELQSILGIILPALITAQLVSLLIVVVIGLVSSRKIAVPLYKIEQWVRQLNSGNLKTRLAFREIGEMKDLTVQCNAITDKFKNTLTTVSEASATIEKNSENVPIVKSECGKIRDALKMYEF
jgi:methyl-accepting chemotaxis protein